MNDITFLDIQVDDKNPHLDLVHNIVVKKIYCYTGQIEVVDLFGRKKEVQKIDVWELVAN